MNGTAQVVKGRIEEAAGALTGNDRLRTKGRSDQAVGQVKQTARKSVRQAKKVANKIVDDAKNSAQDAISKVQRRVAAGARSP